MLAWILLIWLVGCYAPVPIGTPEQIAWQKTEIACFIHWNMGVYSENTVSGCGCGGPVPDITKWNPTSLNTDQWIEAGIKMGCKRFVYVAKHACGFVTWNSKVQNYSYTIANAPNKTDIVAAFVTSAKKYSVGYGFYYTTITNGFVKVCNSIVQRGSAYTQQQYNQIVLDHLSELWGNYGPLVEVWFDGGYDHNLSPQLKNLFSTLQPHTVGFQSEGLMPSPVRWVGTEGGYAPYPCWSTANYGTNGAGSPDSSTWFPAETDFTIQNNDAWFWGSGIGVRPPNQLRGMYETSAGHNTALIIDFGPAPDGTIPQDQVDAATTLGSFITQCYSHPIASTSGQGKNDLGISLITPATVDRIVVQEDQTYGQLIREFTIYATINGKTQKVTTGSSVGNKFIDVLSSPLMQVQSVSFNVTKVDSRSPAGAPYIANFAVYHCSQIAQKLDDEWAKKYPENQ